MAIHSEEDSPDNLEDLVDLRIYSLNFDDRERVPQGLSLISEIFLEICDELPEKILAKGKMKRK